MRLASVIHNATIQIPLKLHSDLLRVSSPPFQPPNCTSGLHRYVYRHIPLLRPAGSNRSRALHSRIACCRGTEKEDDLSTSEGKRIDLVSQDNNNADISHSSSSFCNSEKSEEDESFVSSVKTVALCVCTAVAFGIGVGLKDGVGKASEFFAGYILEQSLSVDNLFVFVLIFKYFKVPIMYQNRVLSYGIAGAVIFRLTLILLGTAALQRFEAVNILLAVILFYSSFKLLSSGEDDTDLSNNFIVTTCQRFIPVTSSYDGNRFFTVEDGIWKATPLLLTVAVIELSDIAFAVDSIPAVFGVTLDPFIVFTSNLFAILGLRSLYTLISEGMSELEYLQPSIAVVLGFIGCKMILDFFGFHVSTEASLGFVATSLSAGVLLSLMKKTD
ncbi:thylakoid membrane protein TERC, chloroplastic [Ziziphus jujuba]|uniref:Thylakoid membrane protein TERC, chloroplastic n=1 Tax=Ziziphus jujuba TaxID=326968 RepID=A0ABM3I677_ZIZJJ|nr:thylakoid membrane protein TERC, chloroplastic [Ziziphus jujuba]